MIIHLEASPLPQFSWMQSVQGSTSLIPIPWNLVEGDNGHNNHINKLNCFVITIQSLCCNTMKVLSTILVLSLAGVSWQDDTVCSTQLCQDLSKTYQSYMRPDVSPCDDFYEYACGNFAKLHPLTDTDLRIGAFSFREDAVVHEVDAAIKAADSSKSSTVRFLSELYMECNDSSKFLICFRSPF